MPDSGQKKLSINIPNGTCTGKLHTVAALHKYNGATTTKREEKLPKIVPWKLNKQANLVTDTQ